MDKVIIFMALVFACFALWIIFDFILKVVRAAKGTSNVQAQMNQKIDDLEADLSVLEDDLSEARKRIEVLEKIVTDEGYDLRRQINDLANDN